MIVYFLLIIAVALLIERWSVKHALDGLKYDLRLSRSLVEQNEEFDIITTVRNTSRRFVPFLKISEDVPRVLGVAARMYTTGFDESRARINSSVYLMPRQKITRRITASLAARGRYIFNGANLYGGDFLGLREKSAYFPAFREAVVLPKREDPEGIEQTLGGFLGDISVTRFILEDPVLTLGFRDYTGREPMKQISWPATARTGRMMVKNYDHTLDITVTVLLNIDTHLYGYMARPAIERCYSLARGVCEILEEKRITYSFCTNALAVNMSNAWDYVPDGLGGTHLATVLEGLGRATYSYSASRGELMDLARRRAETGRAHIIITPAIFDIDDADISSLRNYTGARALLLTGGELSEE